VGSWGEDFYQESIVSYRFLGLEAAFVMDPALIQSVLLDDADSYSKQPLNDDVFGQAIGGGLLNAEGEDWRWQRRLAAPLRRKPWRAGAKFLANSIWKVVLTSLRLPPSIPHPGSRDMVRDGKTMRSVAESVLAKARASEAKGDELPQRLVSARDPATGAAMPDDLIVDNVVTFLIAGHETTSQALTWSLYLLALLPEWQERVREEVTDVAGGGGVAREDIGRLPLLDAVFQEAMRLYPPAPVLMRRTVKPVMLGGISLDAGVTVSVPVMWCTAIAGSGRTRSASIPHASHRKRRPSATAAPIFRSGRARGLASAAPSPWSKGKPS
jgi:cytochrome P450